MAPNKKKSKQRVSEAPQASSSQEEEPALAELSQELEKRSKKRKRTNEDSGSIESSPTSPPSRVLKAPESLSSDLIQVMRAEIASMKQHSKEQRDEMLRIKAKMSAKASSDFPWKKDGNRKQAEIMVKILDFTHQAKVDYATVSQAEGEKRLDGIIKTANERLKILKIADTSPYGWNTVSEFESNLIMANEKEEERLRKAEKSAPEKPAPKRNINNDICYSCGSRGHWANACPRRWTIRKLNR